MPKGGLIEELVAALRCLPGVGPKSAQRMAYHLLERNRPGGLRLAQALRRAMEGVGHCGRCGTLSELNECTLCTNTKRDAGKLCIVETPADVNALEASTGYDGLYYVLMGRLSPLDGIGPRELGLEKLSNRLAREQVQEVILATSATVEGDATAHYVAELAREAGIRAFRIAHGVPVGGELEYVDSGTLAHALHGRIPMEE
ncbi:MAG: recombination protein RecR [Gammaproteobacteria bacterium]|nr:recombination protein RecR [Gammaproteobacteria bacterium]